MSRVTRFTPLGRIVAFVALTLWASGSGGMAQNGSQFKDWRTAALADPSPTKPRLACRALTSMTGYEFSVTRATLVPAGQDIPEHCRIAGQILPEVRFEVNLPSIWNGRLYMFGNGGYAGESFDIPVRVARRNTALKHGFAAVSTNTGHDAAVEPLGSFAVSSHGRQLL